MQWIVHYTSFGDMVSVAVFATDAESAKRLAEKFLKQARVSVIGWREETWKVDECWGADLWSRVRRHDHHVSLHRG